MKANGSELSQVAPTLSRPEGWLIQRLRALLRRPVRGVRHLHVPELYHGDVRVLQRFCLLVMKVHQ